MALNRARQCWQARGLSPLARKIQRDRLTYLSTTRLEAMESAIRETIAQKVPGDYVETGVALGGSAILLASRARENGRAFDGYDVFGMIPPPGPEDPPEVHERYATIAAGQSKGIGGDEYYGYRADLYEHVVASFARYQVPLGESVRLHRGLFEDTLRPSGPVALAHVDCDWYAPVKLCLERLYPVLSPGGYLIIDDYLDYEGARRATDEVLGAHADLKIVSSDSNVVIKRQADVRSGGKTG